MKKRIISLLLAGVMILSLAACGNEKEEQKESSSAPKQSASQTSSEVSEEEPEEIVTLKCYYLGNPTSTEAMAPVLEKINELTREEIGAELDITFIDGGSMQERMNVMMGAGEEMDLVWTGYCNKASIAVENGALLPLTDMLADYPGIEANVPDYALNQCYIDGELYAIPCMQSLAVGQCITLNKALVDKYNFDYTKATRIEDFEPFFEAVAKNEKGVVPFFTNDSTAFYKDFNEKYDATGMPAGYCVEIATGDIVIGAETPEYRYYLDLVHEYYEKGYIMENIISYDRANRTADYGSGKIASWMESYKPGLDAENLTTFGFETVSVNLKTPTLSNPQNGTCVSISATSKYPEKTMALIEMLNTNADLMNLLVYGVEGMHYNLNADGRVVRVEAPTYDQYGFNWVFGNQFLTTLLDVQPEGLWEDTKRINDAGGVSYMGGFSIPSEVKESYKTETTMYSAINNEYKYIFTNGVKDPDEYFDEWQKRCNELRPAVLEKIEPLVKEYIANK